MHYKKRKKLDLTILNVDLKEKAANGAIYKTQTKGNCNVLSYRQTLHPLIVIKAQNSFPQEPKHRVNEGKPCLCHFKSSIYHFSNFLASYRDL